MKSQSVLMLALLAVAVTQATPAAGGPMHGPLPLEQRERIDAMATRHESLVREVELTESGFRAKTTTQDPELAATLKEHVRYMRARLDSGASVRRWDPAYEELVRYYDQLTIDVVEVGDGIEVRVEGATPEAILVAQNHASIVSDFVTLGMDAVHRTHAAAVPE